jgi:hypothetical protein
MKKVLPIFSILLLMAIASCGGESTEETVDSASILGDPIKVGNLLVAQNDFPNQMKRTDAKKACASLGPGWRLPTNDELDILDQNKDKIVGFGSDGYWSSSGGFGGVSAWHQNFVYGLLLEFFEGKRPRFSVRAVRDV